MAESGIAVFDSAVGPCGIAWRASGLAGIQLPEATRPATLSRLERRFADLEAEEAPAWVAAAIGAIRALLAGEEADLAGIRLDFSGLGAFDAAVLAAAREIPRGGTTTYGAIAARLGDPYAGRAVGRALGRNPWPIVVPCHRVTAAAGRTGGFSAHGGVTTKLRLLEIEGALAAESLPLFAAPPKT